MSDCLPESTLKAFFNGMIDSEMEIELICSHLEECESCQARLDAFSPSDYEQNFRDIFLAGDSLDQKDQEIIQEELSVADEMSRQIANHVSPPDGTGENKKERFKIERFVGNGHFFHCLQAFDIWHQRSVLVKVPIDGFLTSKDHHEQFINDCYSAFQLEHNSIIPTLDFGRWDERRWFVCTELLDGIPFDHWIDSAQPTFLSALNAVSQICSGVIHAHRKLVVHRHLDFRNILVADDGDVWLTDFGFVLDQRYQFDLVVNHKRKSAQLPLEFFTLKNDKLIDERSDVYSIGKVLSHVLESTDHSQLPSSRISLFNEIIKKCTNPSRSQRFQTVFELTQEIQSIDPGLSEFGTIGHS